MERPSAPTDFTTPASAERLERVAAALGQHNIEAIIVDTAAEARERVLAMIPEGADVHWAKSLTLEQIGVVDELMTPGRYDPVRPRYTALDRATQMNEIRRLMAAPDYMLGSVHAVTDDGALIEASYSGGQIGPYAASAGRVILVVGSQKIVADVDEGIRRTRDYVMPYEDARLREQLGVPTRLAKLLIIYEEARAGRTTVVLVREPVGF